MPRNARGKYIRELMELHSELKLSGIGKRSKESGKGEKAEALQDKYLSL